jgi:hypothetical protein
MMWISQTLTEQPTQTMLRTDHRMMRFCKTNETAIGQEAQVGVVIVQTRQSIKSDAVQGYKSRSGEQRLFEERDPVDAVVIGHGVLNYPTPL